MAVEFGRHALGRNGPQRGEGGERRRVSCIKQRGDARPLVIAQAGDQMPPQPRARTITDSANQSLEHRYARQQHLVGDQPGRSAIDQRAGPIVTAPAQGVEPSGQPEARHGVVAEVREAAVRPDKREVADATASAETGIDAGRGLKLELRNHGRQYRRRDLGGRNRECPQKPDAGQHHGKAEAIVVAAQRSDQVAAGLIEMEVSRELVGRGFAIEAGKTLALGVGEMTGRHGVRNFQLLRRRRAMPKSEANFFAKHICEIKAFCSNFRTAFGALA
jgi:hypothetical protein